MITSESLLIKIKSSKMRTSEARRVMQSGKSLWSVADIFGQIMEQSCVVLCHIRKSSLELEVMKDFVVNSSENYESLKIYYISFLWKNLNKFIRRLIHFDFSETQNLLFVEKLEVRFIFQS